MTTSGRSRASTSAHARDGGHSAFGKAPGPAIVTVLLAFLLLHGAAASAEPPPLGLGPVPVPAGNPPNPAKIELGRRLFFDVRLSSDGSVSCASCHRPDAFFADDRPFSIGIGGLSGGRNAPSLLNSAYAARLMWDGRSLTLEDQVIYPLMHPREMRNTPERAVRTLAADPDYPTLFGRAFGDTVVTWERVARAVAAFQRTLLSAGAPFDRFMAGDENALTASGRRGYALFTGRAGCVACHVYSRERPLFSDFAFHNIGLAWAATPDLGRYEISRERVDKGAFRTPSLRNVARTAPYMHDGRLRTLADVVAYYARGEAANAFVDPRIRPLHLGDEEKRDLVAFLESLTGNLPDIGSSPPAGQGPK